MYPTTDDPAFSEKISSKKEFYDNRTRSDYPKYICLQPYQKLLANYMSILTSYNSILVNHTVGLGKTISAIAICENLKESYTPLIISKNNIILNNFKEEILSNKCNMDIDIKRYSFYTYGDLVKYNVESLKNKVIIIDEAHNITNNNYYKVIMEILKKSTRVKLVLLSATPVFDNILEAFHIVNLLNIVDKNYIFPSTLSKLKAQKFITYDKKNNEEENVYNLTKKGEEQLEKMIKGKVSFLISGVADFPKKIFKGSSLLGDKSIKVFKTIMTPLQKDVYFKNSENKGILYKNTSDISTMVYPDGSYGQQGFKKWKDTKISLDKLKECSSKLWAILNSVQKSNGIVFIFSNFVSNGGTSLIKKLLKDNGYSKYGTRVDNLKFFSFDESITPNRKTKILKIINSKENVDGKLIKVIIGSPLISEGLTFKNVRQIHVLEPYWNMSRLDQVIGRGVRFKSHEFLSPDDRKVEIFLHAAVFDDTRDPPRDSPIDIYKYKISQLKDYNVKKIEYIFKKHSLDCFLNKHRNKLSSENDFTRDCQYEKCDYTCSYEYPNKIKTKKDTYAFKLHSKEEYNFIREAIFVFFKKVTAASSSKIVEFVRSYEMEKYNSRSVYKNNIYHVIDDIVMENIDFKNGKDVVCNLIKIDKYYIANPKDNKVIESLYKKIFVKI